MTLMRLAEISREDSYSNIPRSAPRPSLPPESLLRGGHPAQPIGPRQPDPPSILGRFSQYTVEKQDGEEVVVV